MLNLCKVAFQFSSAPERNPFGRIPVHQTIEETVNKGTQTLGGTEGFNSKPGAASKYNLTAEYSTMYLRELRDVIGLGSSKLAHPDLQMSRIRKDEADVESLVDLMENSWLNPMCPKETELVSLSTGTVAPTDVAKDLLGAHQTGEEAYQVFKKKHTRCLRRSIPGV